MDSRRLLPTTSPSDHKESIGPKPRPSTHGRSALTLPRAAEKKSTRTREVVSSHARASNQANVVVKTEWRRPVSHPAQSHVHCPVKRASIAEWTDAAAAASARDRPMPFRSWNSRKKGCTGVVGVPVDVQQVGDWREQKAFCPSNRPSDDYIGSALIETRSRMKKGLRTERDLEFPWTLFEGRLFEVKFQ